MRPPRTSAVALWSGIQCAALIVAAVGVHLWPHHPDPPESLALSELVAVQIVAAALLFPALLAEGATVAVIVALLIPAEQLAGLLSATPEKVIWSASGYVALWVVGLAGWARRAKTDLSRACLTAAAVLLTVGGALLWYVAAEAAAQRGGLAPDPSRYGPLLSGSSLAAYPSTTHLVVWGAVAVPFVTSLFGLGRFQPRSAPR